MHKQRILMFSYGSGCVAALYSLTLNFSPDQAGSYALIKQSAERAFERLDARVKYAPEHFTKILGARERIIQNGGWQKHI